MVTYWMLFLAVAIVLTLCAAVAVRLYLGRLASPASRGLFVFSDGVRLRSIDPIAVYLGLEGHKEFRLDLHPKSAAEGNREAMEIEARAVREVFGVPEYTQPGKPGLTVAECHRLLLAWVFYIEAQKKNTSPLSTAAPSTDAMQPPSIEPTTPDSSLSGSVASAPA